MSDGFMAQPNEIKRVSQSFAGQQQVPANLGEMLQGAGAILTGDPSLDAETSALVSQMNSALRALTERLTFTSRGLTQMAQSYRAMDGEVSSRMGAIESGELTAPSAVPAGPSLGIGDQLVPQN